MPNNSEQERNGWLFPTAFAIVAAILVGYVAIQWSSGSNVKAPDAHDHEHEQLDEHDHEHEHEAEQEHNHEQDAEPAHDHAEDGQDEDHDHEGEASHEHENEHGDDAHNDGHDHEAESPKQTESHPAATSPGVGDNTLTISPQAEKNINLTTVKVKVDDFQRTITIPGRVVEQAGHSRVKVSSPLTGIVEKIDTIRGEAVKPGQPLFELRLTHEDVIRQQTELLRLVQQLEIVNRELKRLEKVAASGAIPGKTLLNTQYEAEKLKAEINANKEGLLLLGLTQKQTENIVSKEQLIQKIVITAPNGKREHETCDCEYLLQVAQIDASIGQQVEAGEELGVLTDYCLLLIEGQALEQDAAALNNAVKEELPITAIIELQGKQVEIPNLRILFLDSEVNMETRALRFYAYLPNEVVTDRKSPSGRRFIEWKFRPGQRVELFLPIENWPDCIVLPRQAVIQDGLESIVFVKKGELVTRVPVVEKYRDARVVVVADDGTLRPGQEVVANGAYQLFLKIKNRSAPIDPHAGHNH